MGFEHPQAALGTAHGGFGLLWREIGGKFGLESISAGKRGRKAFYAGLERFIYRGGKGFSICLGEGLVGFEG